jgi:hypothetical protein
MARKQSRPTRPTAIEPVAVTVTVKSPRWTHPDPYTVIFHATGINITGPGANKCFCRFPADSDPVWTGDRAAERKNPLMATFANDAIYVSGVVVTALEGGWQRWRDGDVSAADAITGLKELFAWIDQTARSKPTGELFYSVF